jgi:hypothetical protein
MHVMYLVLTSANCPSPTRADAQRIQDGLWAQAPRDLGIEHISVKARQGQIDVVLFSRSTIHGGMPDESVALATIRNLPFLGIWRVILADSEKNGNDVEWRSR